MINSSAAPRIGACASAGSSPSCKPTPTRMNENSPGMFNAVGYECKKQQVPSKPRWRVIMEIPKTSKV